MLLYGALRTGGIETLIVRMAAALVRNGVPVTVVCEAGTLVASLPNEAQVVVYEGGKNLVSLLRSGNLRLEGAPSFVLVTFDPISAARGLWLEAMLPGITAHLSGIFHTRAYFMTGERRDRVFLNKLVAAAVGFDQLFFMNDECRRDHSEKWRADLNSCPILPLPVNTCEASWQPRLRTELRVVSVGRLVDFKAYNIGAPAIVKECAAAGVDVVWDIFGTGPMHDAIQEEISRHGTEGLVRLRGELPYETFSPTVSGYDVFIGVGTAALEAAMVGLPVICGVDSEKALCYGFLSDLPFGNVGELQQRPPKTPISRLLVDFAKASAEDRIGFSRRCVRAARQYEMQPFLDSLVRLGSKKAGSTIRKKLVGWSYYFLLESPLATLVRRVRTRLA